LDRRTVDARGHKPEIGLRSCRRRDGERADGSHSRWLDERAGIRRSADDGLGNVSGRNGVLQLHEPDAFLLFAGDTPSSTAYGVHKVRISAGKYNVLIGTYTAQGESVTVYRLQPAGT
jgi:hypothetical protein